MTFKFILAVILRDLSQDWGNYKGALIRMLIQPILYLFVFGYVVGSMFPVQGGNYSQVVAPGMVAVSIMNGSFSAVMGVLIPGYYSRSIENLLLAPVSLRAILLAEIASSVAYGFLSSAIVIVLIRIITGITPHGNLLSIALLIFLGSLIFSLLSIIILLFPVRPDKGQELFSLILMPMMFFGCTFYTWSMLPPPWNRLALAFPTTYLSEGLRGEFVPAIPHMDTVLILVGLSVAAAVLLVAADIVFRRRFRDYTW